MWETSTVLALAIAAVWFALRMHRAEGRLEGRADVTDDAGPKMLDGVYTGRCAACGVLSDECARFDDGTDMCVDCLDAALHDGD